MGYSINAFKGFSWHSFFKFFGTFLVAIKLMILARVLQPADFGVFSLVTIALGLTEATTQTGINLILLQTKRSLGYFLDTAWVIAIVRGLLISILMIILSILMSNYYQQPNLLPLITIASFVPLIKGFINPAIISMQKEMRFFRESIYKLSLVMIEVIFAIILGLIFKSVYVLVISMVISAMFEVIVSFIFFPQRPRFNFYLTRAKEIFSQSKWLNMSAILSYLHENLDNLMIGKLTSTTQLGFYHNGYALAHKTNYDLSQSVSHTTLPIFSKIETNKRRLRRAFRRSTLYSMALFTLVSIPFIIYPRLIVIILGDQWWNSINLIRPLTLAGLLQAFANLSYSLFYTKKNYRAVNLHLLLTIVTMVGAILLLTPQYGIVGASWGILISRLASLIVLLFFLIKTLKKNA